MHLKKQCQIFIDEMVRHGNEKLAYRTAYPKTINEDAIRQGCYRLSKNVAVQHNIKEQANYIRSIATERAIENLKEEIKGAALTAAKKREILFNIASGGEIATVVGKDYWDEGKQKFIHKEIPIVRRATILERIRAIEVDNRMAGDNATETLNVLNKAPVDVSKVPVSILLELAQYLKVYSYIGMNG